MGWLAMTEPSKVIHVRNVGPEISEVYSHSLVSVLGKQRNNADEVIARRAVFKRPFYLEFMKFCFENFPPYASPARTKVSENTENSCSADNAPDLVSFKHSQEEIQHGITAS